MTSVCGVHVTSYSKYPGIVVSISCFAICYLLLVAPAHSSVVILLICVVTSASLSGTEAKAVHSLPDFGKSYHVKGKL